jgi:DNA helicase-2/ATP-dependent DNA helicase PcrA
MVRSFSAQLESKSAYELARLIANTTGLLKDLTDDTSPEGISRIENIEELLNAISEFMDSPVPAGEEGELPKPYRTLDEFMQEVALLTDADDKDKEDRNHVSLMTIHAAKGLEFPHVFVVGMEENLFPSFQSLNNRSDLEEERRLFYVAITRGMQSVTLSYAENRYRWGDLISADPSRFIEEIDAEFIEMPKKVKISDLENFHNIMGVDSQELKSKTHKFPTNKRVQKSKQISNPKNLKKLSSFSKVPSSSQEVSDQLDELQVGMEVEHQRFGKGKVISMEGKGNDRKATVFFAAVGQKQLLLRFAKLKIL